MSEVSEVSKEYSKDSIDGEFLKQQQQNVIHTIKNPYLYKTFTVYHVNVVNITLGKLLGL